MRFPHQGFGVVGSVKPGLCGRLAESLHDPGSGLGGELELGANARHGMVGAGEVEDNFAYYAVEGTYGVDE